METPFPLVTAQSLASEEYGLSGHVVVMLMKGLELGLNKPTSRPQSTAVWFEAALH